MYTPYRRARSISQLPDREMISPIPSHGSYFRHGANGGTGSFHSSHPVQDEHIYTKEFSAGAYQTSPLENGSWNLTCSSDLLSNISLFENGFHVGFAGLHGDINSLPNFSGSPGFAFPSKNRSIPSNDPFKDWDSTFGPRLLPPDLGGHVTPNQTSATQSHGSDGWSDNNAWNSGLLVPGHGPLTEPSDNVNGDTMKFDFLHGCIPHPRSAVDNPSISPSIPMQYRSSEISWPHIGTPSSVLDQRFENGAKWDLELQAQSAEMPLHFLPEDSSVGNEFPLPNGSLPAIGDLDFGDVALDSLALLPEQTPRQGYCNIKAKPTLSSPDFIKAVESNIVATQGARNVGRRRGPLNANVREGASKVRKIRACANCRIKKIRCSGGDICDPCLRNHARRTFQWAGCLRKALDQYTEIFCPSFLFEHLGQVAIKSWIETSGMVNTDNEVMVQVSSGPFLKSMMLMVREIRVPNQDFLVLPDLSSSNDQDHNFASIPTLQYALHECEVDQVKLKCLEYIKAISNCPLEDPENAIGDTPKIIWRSVEAIRGFLRSNSAARRNGLLEKALNVYWIQYAMSRTFVFNDQSAIIAITRLRSPSAVHPSQPDISARVLNRQLKGALKILYEELLRDLLKGLEHEYKSKARKSWLQTAIDGLVIYNISQKGEDPVRAVESGTKSCQQLEELPTKYSWAMFFGMYKSYNPIRDGCLPDDDSGLNQGEAELINTFAQIIRENEDDILKWAASPCSGGTSQITAHHKEFRARNSSKHLSVFLKKYL